MAAGSQALLRPGRYAAAAEPLAEQIAPMLKRLDSRLPTNAEALVRINGAIQVGAGVLLATSTAPRPAAAVLAGTLVPTTLVGHPFWKVQNVAMRRAEQMQFAKNLGLFAGLLLAAADTAGSPGLRWRAEHAAKHAERAMKQAKKKVTRHH